MALLWEGDERPPSSTDFLRRYHGSLRFSFAFSHGYCMDLCSQGGMLGAPPLEQGKEEGPPAVRGVRVAFFNYIFFGGASCCSGFALGPYKAHITRVIRVGTLMPLSSHDKHY